MATILMIGAFDTKGLEYAFLREELLTRGHQVIAVDTGVVGESAVFPIDVRAEEVAQMGESSLETLRAAGDRGLAMKVMSAGAALCAKTLYTEGRFAGIIGMGGSGGSSVVTAAMRALPVGVPKVCISTVASGDTSAYVGAKDVVLIPSIVDVAGMNRISRVIFSRAAGAISGMVEREPMPVVREAPVVVASMFGNTTECVNACAAQLGDRGYEVLVFHATGMGGRTMESLVSEGLVDGVLDITTTEWADEICGGVFSAGSTRLEAASAHGVPQLVVPGCIDMANFGGMDTVPRRYKDAERLFYEWNPAVTLMRTNADENAQMGRIFAEKANASIGPVAFLLPLEGVSILDGDGELFCDREADRAFFNALKNHLRSDIPVYEAELNINAPAFSARAVELLLGLMSEEA
ncbi:MAG: Tm-1-like ATP-binding domain-containing protein [Candidatus Latescibacterota bacterium]|nr:Tm-1-like ATP-binding domain-containing protein [Candidatus Latescibacterota bacterium]